MKHAIRSSWPSQMMAQRLSSKARLDLSRPNMTLPLVKMGLSGELTYLADFLVTGKNPSAKANDAALLVANRKNQAAPKAVVIVVGPFLAQNQAGLLDQRRFKIFALGPIDGVVPSLGRIAQAEKLNGFLPTPRRAR